MDFNNVNVTSGTDSAGIGSGTMVVIGGTSVSKSLYVGGKSYCSLANWENATWDFNGNFLNGNDGTRNWNDSDNITIYTSGVYTLTMNVVCDTNEFVPPINAWFSINGVQTNLTVSDQRAFCVMFTGVLTAGNVVVPSYSGGGVVNLGASSCSLTCLQQLF